MSDENPGIQTEDGSIANSSSGKQSDQTDCDPELLKARNTYCNTELLRARIDAVAQAQKRSRAAFLASTIISLAILIAMWNAYLSWYRSFFGKWDLATPQVTQEAQKALIGEWVRSLKVSIPVLGIEAGVGDGAIVGSVSLYIVCIWVFLSMRRENHIIFDLLKETKICDDKMRIMVFHGIVSFSVFTIISTTDAAMDDLDKEPPQKRVKLVRLSYKGLILLPAFTIISIVAMDLLSIFFLKSPFREGNGTLWHNLSLSHGIKRGIMESLCLFLFWPTVYLCARIIGFDNSTEKILKQYQSRLPKTNNHANESASIV
jgi:hypothetical protein